MRKYSLLIIPFLYWGCEQTFDNSIDVTQNDYQVVSIAGIKDTIDLKIPGDSLLNVRVIFASGSQFNSVYFDVYSSDNEKLNSTPVELVQISGNIYQNSFELRREYPIGIYTVRIFVIGTDGKTNQAALNNFYFNNGQDNVAPFISNLVMPDSIAKGVTFIFTITASDSNGLNDILYVYFELYRPDSTVVQNPPGSGNTLIFMDDTGDFEHFGDETAGDGIYSFKNFFLDDPSTQTGLWRFVFQARDRSGVLSNQIIHFLEVI